MGKSKVTTSSSKSTRTRKPQKRPAASAGARATPRKAPHPPATPKSVRILTFSQYPNGIDEEAKDSLTVPFPLRVRGKSSTSNQIRGRLVRLDTGQAFNADGPEDGYSWTLLFTDDDIPKGVDLLLQVWMAGSIALQGAGAQDCRVIRFL